MNLILAASGYPWVVIPLAERGAYMAALEKASVGEDIGPFADLLARLWKNAWRASRFRPCRGNQSEVIVALQHARTHTSASAIRVSLHHLDFFSIPVTRVTYVAFISCLQLRHVNPAHPYSADLRKRENTE